MDTWGPELIGSYRGIYLTQKEDFGGLGKKKWICIIFKLHFIKPFGNRHLVVFTLTCMAIKALGLKF